MSRKVYEIAKELEMESKELLEKLHAMGVEAKSHSSTVSDIDAKAVENMILHSRRKAAETKIVQAAPKKAEPRRAQPGEPRIEVKAAPVATQKPKERVEIRTRVEGKPAAPRPEAAQPQRTGTMAPPTGTPLPRSASAQPPVGTPLPKSASLQPSKVKGDESTEAMEQKTSETPAPAAAPVPADVPAKTERPETKKPEAQPEKKPEPSPFDDVSPEFRPVEPRMPKIIIPASQAQQQPAPRPTPRPAEGQERRHEPRPAGTTEGRPAPRSGEGRPPQRTADGRPPYRPADGRPPQRTADGRPPQRTADGRPPQRTADGRPATRPDGRPPYRPADGRPPQRTADGRPAPGRPGDRPGAPRPAKPEAAVPGAPAKKGKKDKPEEKRDKVEGRKDVRKKGAAPLRSMEKPTLKKPRRQKQERPVEEEKRLNLEELAPGTKVVNVPITVKGFSEQVDRTSSEVIMALMKLGIMANVNQNLDEDTVVLLGAELGIQVVVDKVEEEAVEEGLELFEDKEEDLKARPPIITVMGHVDHGKTSLLDAIRKTNVTATESGGITQHIGASEVTINGQKIVFLDTPGHEAFTAMRARGAHVTDIAVLVVAADDSVKPQTIESISHAKAAGVPIIVAVNKIDKEGANPDRVKQDLANLGDNTILVEEYGGETICVPVSAKTGEGIVNLLEMILLQAEVLELKANPNRMAMGTVIEARLDKAKGPVATLLVTNGTLQSGMSVVAGTCHGKIRAMTNYKGDKIRKAGPATAVEILGLTDVPEAGDEFNALTDDKQAREIAEQRRIKVREEVMVRNSSITLEQLFSQIQSGEVKELNLILKGDVQGSVGALTQSLEKLQTENVKVRIIHSGVGTVTESDIMLASTSKAIIIGFNVRPSTNITTMAERENVEIRTYRIIYEIIDDIEAALKGMLDPIFKEVVMGKIEIRETFKVPGIGLIGGAYVLEGKVQRNAQIRLVRDGIVIHEGKISSLKRFKDDAKEVAQGYECGIGIENYNDVKVGDIIEAFKMEEIERK